MSNLKVKIQESTARIIISNISGIRQNMKDQNELRYILMEEYINKIVSSLSKYTYQDTISMNLTNGKVLTLFNILHIQQKYYAKSSHLYENNEIQENIDKLTKHIVELKIKNYATLV